MQDAEDGVGEMVDVPPPNNKVTTSAGSGPAPERSQPESQPKVSHDQAPKQPRKQRVMRLRKRVVSTRPMPAMRRNHHATFSHLVHDSLMRLNCRRRVKGKSRQYVVYRGFDKRAIRDNIEKHYRLKLGRKFNQRLKMSLGKLVAQGKLKNPSSAKYVPTPAFIRHFEKMRGCRGGGPPRRRGSVRARKRCKRNRSRSRGLSKVRSTHRSRGRSRTRSKGLSTGRSTARRKVRSSRSRSSKARNGSRSPSSKARSGSRSRSRSKGRSRSHSIGYSKTRSRSHGRRYGRRHARRHRKGRRGRRSRSHSKALSMGLSVGFSEGKVNRKRARSRSRRTRSRTPRRSLRLSKAHSRRSSLVHRTSHLRYNSPGPSRSPAQSNSSKRPHRSPRPSWWRSKAKSSRSHGLERKSTRGAQYRKSAWICRCGARSRHRSRTKRRKRIRSVAASTGSRSRQRSRSGSPRLSRSPRGSRSRQRSPRQSQSSVRIASRSRHNGESHQDMDPRKDHHHHGRDGDDCHDHHHNHHHSEDGSGGGFKHTSCKSGLKSSENKATSLQESDLRHSILKTRGGDALYDESAEDLMEEDMDVDNSKGKSFFQRLGAAIFGSFGSSKAKPAPTPTPIVGHSSRPLRAPGSVCNSQSKNSPSLAKTHPCRTCTHHSSCEAPLRSETEDENSDEEEDDEENGRREVGLSASSSLVDLLKE